MSAPKASRPARDRQFASTLAHGLQLLRCFTPEAAVLSNRQLSELSGLSKPTVSRYTYTLIELGYLKVDPVSGKFQLGNAVLTLSYPLLANIALRQVVRSPMRELAERLGCSVSLCMRERLSMVYVETSRSRCCARSATPTSACRTPSSPRPMAAPISPRAARTSAIRCSTRSV